MANSSAHAVVDTVVLGAIETPKPSLTDAPLFPAVNVSMTTSETASDSRLAADSPHWTAAIVRANGNRTVDSSKPKFALTCAILACSTSTTLIRTLLVDLAKLARPVTVTGADGHVQSLDFGDVVLAVLTTSLTDSIEIQHSRFEHVKREHAVLAAGEHELIVILSTLGNR